VVIGAGMAGLDAMDRAVAAGRTVAVIARDRDGGTGPIRGGGIPSTALIRNAEVARESRRAAAFGIRVGGVEVDLAAVTERVRGIIDTGATETRRWVESLATVELIAGEASFVSPTEVRVGERTVRAPRIVIATGAAPSMPPAGARCDPAPDERRCPSAHRAPHAAGRHRPRPIALELGQALARLGAPVTTMEVQPRLLPSENPEIVHALREFLAGEGLGIHTGTRMARTAALGCGGVRVVVTERDASRAIDADAPLVATGRAPIVAPLDLAAAGLEDSAHGIRADGCLETSHAGIDAVGDVSGGPWGQFTRVARGLGVEVVEQALGLGRHDVRTDIGPDAVLTDPELASIGLTEQAARKAGHTVPAGFVGFAGGTARTWGTSGAWPKWSLRSAPAGSSARTASATTRRN
jgi:pyruvate/2-oxoglutarate dehydrogenase complex dihydrolipoamide dehydrogenase (E3) component